MCLMRKRLLWGAAALGLLFLIWNMGRQHVDGVRSEKEWYLSELGFDFSGVVDSAEKKGQALFHVRHGKLDTERENVLKKELRFNGMLDLFIYRADGKSDMMLPDEAGVRKGDSVYVNSQLKIARFFRNDTMIYERSLLKSLRGRPF